ncbi:MAG: hypothetical protein ABIN67_04640 [Ferruginibacter sp.]
MLRIMAENTSNEVKSIGFSCDLSSQKFYHGIKSSLKPGDLIEAGLNLNYGTGEEGALYI